MEILNDNPGWSKTDHIDQLVNLFVLCCVGDILNFITLNLNINFLFAQSFMALADATGIAVQEEVIEGNEQSTPLPSDANDPGLMPDTRTESTKLAATALAS